MEVLNENSALLSNFEVLELLQDVQNGQRGQRKPGKQQGQLATITYETIQFLQKSPCSKQSADAIKDCMKRLDKYKLTKAERLSVINLAPRSAVEIQLIIEESEERLSEEQIEQLLRDVRETLPLPDDAQQE